MPLFKYQLLCGELWRSLFLWATFLLHTVSNLLFWALNGAVASGLHDLSFLTQKLRPRLGMIRTLVREGNGNPLQYSCLANPMDGGAL